MAPDLDSTTTYAQAVVDGDLVCSRAVRLAAARHLDGLQRQTEPSYLYEFDAGAADHVIRFFPKFLTLEDGAPFILHDWQCFITGNVYGWKKKADGTR